MVEIKFCDRCQHIFKSQALYCQDQYLLAKASDGFCGAPLSSAFFKDKQEAKQWLLRNFSKLSEDEIDEILAVLFV